MISRWQSCMLFLFLYQVAQRHECNATACLQGSIGTVFGRMGSQVILSCSGGQAANTRVLWKHNGMQVNRVSNESSIILNMTSLSLAGHYSCIDESTQRKLRDFQLCVGYPPDKPIVSCHSFNYPDAFRCQWQPQTTQLVSFTAKYRPLPREPEEECLIVNATTCMGTQTFLFSTTPVQLTVIASNEFGETSSTTYFILEDIVKPDPPRKVWARWRNFAHITWRAPISWSDEELYPLMYQVRYRGQHSSQWQLVEVADFNRNIKLKELLPWEDYFVQVSAKDFLDNGFWSAWSPTLKLKAKCAVVSFVNKYAPIGSNITIPCTLPEPTGKPSKEFRKPRVIWKLNGYRLRKSSAYSLKRRRLSIQHVKPSDEGRYTCHLQRDRFRVHLVKLLVGNPPAKLSISCHSNNYPESFRCQWQPPMTFLKNNYTTKLWNPSRNSFEECTLIGETTCEARNLTLFAVRPYRLVVTAKNALGYSQTNHSFFLEEIVQPNSPEQVTCRMKGNGNLQITWTMPKSWTSDPAFPLKYRLQFRQEEQQEWIEEHIPKKNTKSFVLRVPVVSASYLVRLAARDQDTGHWSEWSSVAKVENM